MNPKSIYGFINLASSYDGLGNHKVAIETFLSTLRIQANPDAHGGLVISYVAIGDKRSAQIHLDHFKRLAPNSKYIPGLEQEVRNIK